MADGTEFVIDIPVNADGVPQASTALETLAQRLDASKAASAAAASAVEQARARYAQYEVAADKAAKASEKIAVQGQAAQGKLAAALETGDTKKIEKAMAALDALRKRNEEAMAVNEAAQAKLIAQANEVDSLAAKAKEAAAAQADLSKQLSDLDAAKAREAAEAEAELARKAAEVEAAAAAELAEQNAAAARMAEYAAEKEAELAAAAEETAAAEAKAGAGGSVRLNEVGESLGKMGGPAGMVGQKIAGIGNAFQKMAAMGPVALFAAIAVAAIAVVAGLVAAGAALAKFAIAQADAARTSLLLSQGVTQSVEGGIALEQSIAALGAKVPLTADELRSMAGELAKTGLKGQALTDALEESATKAARLKFGPEFGKQMLSLDMQSQRLKGNVGRIFGGLQIEGFLSALHKAGGLFEENSSSAKAIKAVFESLFQPIVDGAAGMIPKVVSAFIQFEIWALKTLIAIKPYGFVFRGIGQAVVFTAQVVGLSFSLMYEVATATIAGFVALGQAGSDALGWLSAKAIQVREFLLGLSLSDVGMAMIDGLTGGLITAGPKVLEAITGIANSAITAAKKALGIASPSKVFAEIGSNTAAGMTEGVDSGSAGVTSALESMVAPPDAGAGGAGGASVSTSNGGNTYNVTVNVDGAGGGGDDLAQKIVAGIRDYFESVAGQVGEQEVTA